jgi:hypothetical protein
MSEIEIGNSGLAIAGSDLTVGTQFVVKTDFGIQVVIRFPNDYGLSVIQNPFTRGKWESAPIRFVRDGLDFESWEFCGQDKGIPGFEFDDVQGWMSPSDVDSLASLVARL